MLGFGEGETEEVGEAFGFPPTARRMTPSTTSAVFELTARACPLSACAFARAEFAVEGEAWPTAGEAVPEPDALALLGVPGAACVM